MVRRSSTSTSSPSRAPDAADEYPAEIVEQMKALGLLGIIVPERYGGMGLDFTTYAMIIEELARGWISVAGVVNTHLIGAYLLEKFGTDRAKGYFLPRMVTGELRGAFSLSEPDVGSDVQGLKASATPGSAATGASRPEDVGHRQPAVKRHLRASQDGPGCRPGVSRHHVLHRREGARGIAVNTGAYAGLTIFPKIPKMGYRGIETSEVVFDGYRRSPDRILGGPDALGQGFRQMMDALETGRINVAARGVGIGQRALELALKYSQERVAFGRPIAHHQAVQFKLADMATKVEASRLLTRAGREHEGRRRPLRPRSWNGKAIRMRVGQRGRRGRDADPRWLRLLEGIRDRTAVPRRSVAADRRGHLRHPADDDRSQAVGAYELHSE